MNICVDATSLLLRSAGVKNYVYYWMRALQQFAPEHQISGFPLLDRFGPLNHEGSVLSLPATIPRIALLHFMNIRGNPAMNWLMRDVDVFHASNQVRNPPRNTRLTGTLYDMTCLLMPENHTPANVQAERNYADKVLSRAHGLIAISEHTRTDALKALSIHPDRIKVIYPGVSESFFQVTEDEINHAKARYELKRPYALFVGTIEPRKNVDRLLDAWGQLPADIREEFDLVLAGPVGWAQAATVGRIRSTPGVRYLGYLPEFDLPAVTAGATAFVYPSLYEGFGLPVAQALAAEVPVITSNVSSLPEVAGAAALLVDPQSTVELSKALFEILTSPAMRSQLSATARGQAKRYTWQNCARESAAFFNHLP